MTGGYHGPVYRDVQISCKQRAAPVTALVADDDSVSIRGRGMVQGIAFADAERGPRVSRAAFERGLLVETSGPKDEVVKLLPALTTTDEQLDIGIATLREAITESAQ